MVMVFDRIRENLRLNPGEVLNPVINFSIMQTLARSVITGEPAGIRTRNQGIKSPLLYR